MNKLVKNICIIGYSIFSISGFTLLDNNIVRGGEDNNLTTIVPPRCNLHFSINEGDFNTICDTINYGKLDNGDFLLAICRREKGCLKLYSSPNTPAPSNKDYITFDRESFSILDDTTIHHLPLLCTFIPGGLTCTGGSGDNLIKIEQTTLPND